jgi:hypothetical protein
LTGEANNNRKMNRYMAYQLKRLNRLAPEFNPGSKIIADKSFVYYRIGKEGDDARAALKF